MDRLCQRKATNPMGKFLCFILSFTIYIIISYSFYHLVFIWKNPNAKGIGKGN